METVQEIPKAEPKKRRLTKSFFFITAVSGFGSVQYGYNLWVVYSPSVLMQDFYNISYRVESRSDTDPNVSEFLMGVTIALFPLGGIVGALSVGPLVDHYGRKGALIITSFFSIISAILTGCSKAILAYEFTMVSRLLTGICSGVFHSAVPIYLAEISPSNLRGVITMSPHLFLTFGVLLAQVLALREILGTKEGWPVLMGLVGILGVFQLVFMPSFPESPRFLLIQRRDEEKAKEALKQLRGEEDVEKEMEEMCQEDLAEKAEKQINSLSLLCFQDLRWQVFSIVVLICGQQLAGVTAAYFYTERIYMATKVALNKVRYISIGSTFVFLLSTLIGMCLVDVLGRKILLLFGFTLSGACCVVLCITIQYQNDILWVSYLSAIFVDAFMFGHSMGPGPLPNVIVAELFLQSSRSSAYIIGGFVYWFLYFLTGVTFLHVEKALKSFSFLLFLPACIITFTYVLMFLPETKNKTFLDIRKLMTVQEAKKIVVKAQAVK